MRSAPPVRIDAGVPRSARWFVMCVLATAGVAFAIWLAQKLGADERSTVIGMALCAIAMCARDGRASWAHHAVERQLVWDSRQWCLSTGKPSASAMRPGNLSVALDLGFWMLLRFSEPASPAPRPRLRKTHWLPVSRRALMSDWHALRCAVYCARPGARRGDPGEPADI